MNDSVLLFIDQKRRDTLPVILIYYYLKSQGVDVRLASVLDFFMKFIYYKPKVVMQANPDIYHGDWSRFIAHFSLIACLPTEQQITHQKSAVDRVLEGHNPKSKFKKPYVEGVFRFYIWGRQLADLLRNNKTVSSKQFEAKIKVTGCPRLVNYGYYLKDHFATNDNKKFTIGVALEDDFNNKNVSQFLYELRDYTFHDFGESVENYCCLFIYINIILLRFLDRFLLQKNMDILIRPRLGDSKENYKFLSKKFRNVRFDVEDSPHDLFNNIDCLILAQSSIGTEAQIAGIPVISIYGLLDKEISFFGIDKDAERLKYYWKPKSFEELEHLIELAREKQLNVTPDEKGFERFIKSVYLGSLNKEHPSKIIADDIKNILDNFENLQDTNCGGNEHEAQIDYFRGLLPGKLRSKIVSRILYNNVTKDALLWRTLTAVIFFFFRAGLYLYYRLGRVDTNRCFLDYDKEIFNKYEVMYEEINNDFERLNRIIVEK